MEWEKSKEDEIYPELPAYSCWQLGVLVLCSVDIQLMARVFLPYILLRHNACLDDLDPWHVGVRRGFGHRQGLHVGMHGFCDSFAVRHGVNHGACAVGNIACREYAGAGGVSVFVNRDDAAALFLDALGGVDDAAAELLADRDDDARAGIELLAAGDGVQLPVLVIFVVGEDHAVVHDLQRGLHQREFHALKLRVAGLILAGGKLVAAVEDRHILGAVSDSRPGAVHGGVA